MKILLVGPGIIPIPPNGFGAVEKLIWEYYLELQKLGHEVEIINSPNRQEIIKKSKELDWDIVHVHYDCFYDILPLLRGKKIIISSHYPYIDQVQRHQYDDYHKIFKFMIEHAQYYPIFAVSAKDKETYINWGTAPTNIHLMINGIDPNPFVFAAEPIWKNQTVTLGQINERKRQYLSFSIDRVKYIGKGPSTHPNYLGEVADYTKHSCLTNFANMLLLTNGENSTPLAIKEGLIAGLGIVTTEAAASELDRSCKFITILSERDIQNPKIISEALEANAQISLSMREEIRSYGMQWSWDHLIPKYVENLESLL
jgi:hypothetical protein